MKSFNRIRCLNNVVSEIIDEYKLEDAVVADIATDHGYLAELLSRNEKINKVIATDISQKCLNKTNELKNRFNLEKIETKLGDGLKPIEKVDIAVMAGIGGYEIIKILSNQNITKNNDKKCSIFVLQPTKNFVEVRKFLMDRNVQIFKDFIIKSGGKFYPIICVNFDVFEQMEESVFNIYFGKTNSTKNAEFLEFLMCEKNKLSFLNNIDKNEIENSDDLKTKFQILELAENLIKNSKGEE